MAADTAPGFEITLGKPPSKADAPEEDYSGDAMAEAAGDVCDVLGVSRDQGPALVDALRPLVALMRDVE